MVGSIAVVGWLVAGAALGMTAMTGDRFFPGGMRELTLPAGELDRLCLDPEENLFVHDQKTTGTTIGPYYFKGFKPDIQFSLYTLAAKIIYNLIGKTTSSSYVF